MILRTTFLPVITGRKVVFCSGKNVWERSGRMQTAAATITAATATTKMTTATAATATTKITTSATTTTKIIMTTAATTSPTAATATTKT